MGLGISEKIGDCGKPLGGFDETFRTAMSFLANSCKLWVSDRLDYERTVLKLVFAYRLYYIRNEGFRTADLSIPFKVLADLREGKNKMARLDGETSNELFEVLAEWNDYLEHRKSDDFQVPPCP